MSNIKLTVDLFYNLTVSESEEIQRRKLLDVLDKVKTPTEDGVTEEPDRISEVLAVLETADSSFNAIVPQPPPYVEIVEQPASKAHRFRYPCESRSTGSVPGASSTAENKTYPAIKIHNYVGEVGIVVSCVTTDKPYRPHPHHLTGKGDSSGGKKGVCALRIVITAECNEYKFTNLSIQCVRKRDMVESLRVRETLKVDPFHTGFDHARKLQDIDSSAVRLCFQVLLPDEVGRFREPLAPVVSNIIYDKKTKGDLLICRTSHCSGTIAGGTTVILLCEKVDKEDTIVEFYSEENNEMLWSATANIVNVHKNIAIVIETPPYKEPRAGNHVKVRFRLKGLREGNLSNSLPFEYIPEYPDVDYKRRKIAALLGILQEDDAAERIHASKSGSIGRNEMREAKLHQASRYHPDLTANVPKYEFEPNFDNAYSNISHPYQNIQSVSPKIQPSSPKEQPISPYEEVVSPYDPMSPYWQHATPSYTGQPAPSLQEMGSPTPAMQYYDQNFAYMSPNLEQSPSPDYYNMG